MADKNTDSYLPDDKPINIYSPYAPVGYDGSIDMDQKHKPSWTDSFPHGFHGWGPQTPEPDSELERQKVAGELTWREKSEADRDHVIWRFDRKQHH